MTLADAPARRPMKVVDVAIGSRDRTRLTELGLRRGSTVEVLRRAPLGGPLALRSAGGRFALRAEDAGRVLVEHRRNDG